jgi:hypothetical protein
MLQFNYKLKVAERVKAECERHPRYNPEREGRAGIKAKLHLFLSFRPAPGAIIAGRRLQGASKKSINSHR